MIYNYKNMEEKIFSGCIYDMLTFNVMVFA